jgi:hypothetical protein
MAKTQNAARDMVRHLSTASAALAGVEAQDVPIKVAAYKMKIVRSHDAREGEETLPAFDNVDQWLIFLAESTPLQLGLPDLFRLARDTGRINTIRQALGANALACQLTPDNLAAMVKALDLLGFECGQILLACKKIGQLATVATCDDKRADLLAKAVIRRVLNLVRP